MTLNQKEQELARIMRDPVLWAEAHLGQKPRWYQEQALRHPHNRIVLRWGRRTGKCIAEGQRIANSETGEYKPIEEWFKDQRVPMISMDDHFKLGKNTSFKIEQNGVKETYTVKTKNGAEVTLTGNHPVLTMDGWKEVDLLKEGEEIATPKIINAFGEDKVDPLRARVLAYVGATHDINKFNATLTLLNDETRHQIVENVKAYGLSVFPKTPSVYFVVDKEDDFLDILTHTEEVIPDEVFRYNRESLAIFLASIFDAKGWLFTSKTPEIGYGTKSEKFAKSLSHLLLRFGMQATVSTRQAAGEPYYHIIMSSKYNMRVFLKEIAVYSIKSYKEIQDKIDTMKESKPTIPKSIWPYIEERRDEQGLKNWQVTGSKEDKFKRHVGVNEDRALAFSHNLKDEYLYDLATSDVLWQKVLSITPAGKQMTYDVHMPENHNLIVEDTLVHNTWTMASHMLWAAFTNIGGTQTHGRTVCLVATPYDSQARLIFDQLKEFINGNEILSSSVKSMTKNPYYIQFKNEAEIKLYTAGTKSGGEGASIRGQKASYLYMDKFCPLVS